MTTTCPVCGRDVEQPRTGRPKIYDTLTCRQQAQVIRSTPVEAILRVRPGIREEIK